MLDARSNSYVLIYKNRPFKVLVCAITLVAFLFNIVSYDLAWAAGTPSELTSVGSDRAVSPGLSSEARRAKEDAFKELNPATFTLPQHLGTIKDSWSSNPGASSQGPGARVIHIQDAHCNYDAQHKIAEIIEYLNKIYGVKTVNMEGGAKDYDISIFTGIKDKNVRGKVADYFVKEGVVNGAEYFAINNPEKVTLWGIEDVRLYIDNLKIYRNSLEYKDEVDKYLKNLSYILSNLKVKIYSKELLELDSRYNAYKVNNADFKDYLVYLLQKAKERLIDIKSYTNIYLLSQTLGQEAEIDFRRANNERDELIDKLGKKLSKNALEELVLKTVEFKAERMSQADFYQYLAAKAKSISLKLDDFPELAKYSVYVATYQVIDKSKIMDEVASLEDKLKALLFTNDKDRELDVLSKNLALTKNMFNISLTRDDYRYYKANERSFEMRNFAKFIEREAPLCKIQAKLDENIGKLDDYREDICKFYEYSFRRDKAFLKNINLKKTSIIVTGGFHTENLCEIFKKQGISYVSIIPNFKNENGYESPYFTLLAGKNNKIMTALAQGAASTRALALYSYSCEDSADVYGISKRNFKQGFAGWVSLAERAARSGSSDSIARSVEESYRLSAAGANAEKTPVSDIPSGDRLQDAARGGAETPRDVAPAVTPAAIPTFDGLKSTTQRLSSKARNVIIAVLLSLLAIVILPSVYVFKDYFGSKPVVEIGASQESAPLISSVLPREMVNKVVALVKKDPRQIYVIGSRKDNGSSFYDFLVPVKGYKPVVSNHVHERALGSWFSIDVDKRGVIIDCEAWTLQGDGINAAYLDRDNVLTKGMIKQLAYRLGDISYEYFHPRWFYKSYENGRYYISGVEFETFIGEGSGGLGSYRANFDSNGNLLYILDYGGQQSVDIYDSAKQELPVSQNIIKSIARYSGVPSKRLRFWHTYPQNDGTTKIPFAIIDQFPFGLAIKSYEEAVIDGSGSLISLTKEGKNIPIDKSAISPVPSAAIPPSTGRGSATGANAVMTSVKGVGAQVEKGATPAAFFMKRQILMKIASAIVLFCTFLPSPVHANTLPIASMLSAAVAGATREESQEFREMVEKKIREVLYDHENTDFMMPEKIKEMVTRQKIDPKIVVDILTEKPGFGLKDNSFHVRYMAIEIVASMDDERRNTILSHAFTTDVNENVRRVAVVEYIPMAGKDAVKLLTDKERKVGIYDKAASVRRAVVDWIPAWIEKKYIKTEEALRIVTVGLKDSDAGIREESVQALIAAVKYEKAVEFLLNHNDLSDKAKVDTMLALGSFAKYNGYSLHSVEASKKKEITDKFIVMLRAAKEAESREQLLVAIGNVAGDAAAEIFLATEGLGINDSDKAVVLRAAEILGRLIDTTVEDPFTDDTWDLKPLNLSDVQRKKITATLLGILRGKTNVDSYARLLSVISTVAGSDSLDILMHTDGIGLNSGNDAIADKTRDVLADIIDGTNINRLTDDDIMMFLHFSHKDKIRNILYLALRGRVEVLRKAILEVTAKLRQNKPVDPKEFNMLIFVFSGHWLSAEDKVNIFPLVNKFIISRSDIAERNMYLYSFSSVIKQLSGHEQDLIAQKFPDEIGGMRKLMSDAEKASPPYQDIFHREGRPNNELNIRLYAPQLPEEYDKMFKKKGYSKEIDTKNNATVYRITMNGKNVSVYFDSTGNADHYEGEIFKYIGDPNTHVIAYSGHSNNGNSLKKAFDSASKSDILQCGNKIIFAGCCNSALIYSSAIAQLFPYSQFIGTKNWSYYPYHVAAVQLMIEGLTKEASWNDIKKEIDKVTPSLKKEYNCEDDASFMMPNDPERFKFFNFGGDIATTGHDAVLYVPASGIIFLSDNDIFDIEPGNIDLTRVRTEKAQEALARVIYFFGLNDYLKDMAGSIKRDGFRVSFMDNYKKIYLEEPEVVDGKKSYAISVNAGYRNCSQAAITMMLLHEANLYFSEVKSGKVTKLDELRGLQLAAQFAKYYHKENLFPAFLKKYGYKDVPIEEFLNTLAPHTEAERVKALNEILLKLTGNESLDQERLKKEGLLSYSPTREDAAIFGIALVRSKTTGELLNAVLANAMDRKAELLSQAIDRRGSAAGTNAEKTPVSDISSGSRLQGAARDGAETLLSVPSATDEEARAVAEKAREVIRSLMPKDNDLKTEQAFEDYLRNKLAERDKNLTIKRHGFFNIYRHNLAAIRRSFADGNYYDLPVDIMFLIINWYVPTMANGWFERIVEVPARHISLQRFIAAALASVPFVLTGSFITFVIASLFVVPFVIELAFFSLFGGEAASLRHELKHIYIDLVISELRNRSNGGEPLVGYGITELLGRDEGLGKGWFNREELTEKEFYEIEENIVRAIIQQRMAPSAAGANAEKTPVSDIPSGDRLQGAARDGAEKPEGAGKVIELPAQFMITDDNARRLLAEALGMMPDETVSKIFDNVKQLTYPDIESSVGTGFHDNNGAIRIGCCFDPLYFIELALHEIAHSLGSYEYYPFSHRYVDGFALYILYPDEFRMLAKDGEWAEAYDFYKTKIFNGKEYTGKEAGRIHDSINMMRDQEIEQVKKEHGESVFKWWSERTELHRHGLQQIRDLLEDAADVADEGRGSASGTTDGQFMKEILYDASEEFRKDLEQAFVQASPGVRGPAPVPLERGYVRAYDRLTANLVRADRNGQDRIYVYPLSGPDIFFTRHGRVYAINNDGRDFDTGETIARNNIGDADASVPYANNLDESAYAGLDALIKDNYATIRSRYSGVPITFILKGFNQFTRGNGTNSGRVNEVMEYLLTDFLKEGDRILVLDQDDILFADLAVEHGFVELFKREIETGRKLYVSANNRDLLIPNMLMMLEKRASTAGANIVQAGNAKAMTSSFHSMNILSRIHAFVKENLLFKFIIAFPMIAIFIMPPQVYGQRPAAIYVDNGLLTRLNDKTTQIRINAIEEAVKTLGREAIPLLTERPGIGLNDEKVFVRNKAIKTIIKTLGKDAVLLLAQKQGIGLTDKYEYVRRDTVRLIGQMVNDKEIAPLLTEKPGIGLLDEYPSVRGETARVVVALLGREAIPLLTERPGIGLIDKEESVRRRTVQAIGKILDEDSILLLTERPGIGLNDKDAYVQMETIDTIGNILGREAIPLLTERPGIGLNSKDERVRKEAVYVIGKKLGRKAMPLLTEKQDACLNDKNALVREEAVTQIGQILGKEAMPLLTETPGKCLNDSDPAVRSRTIVEICRMMGKEVLPLLSERPGKGLNDTDVGVRLSTVKEILGMWNNEDKSFSEEQIGLARKILSILDREIDIDESRIADVINESSRGLKKMVDTLPDCIEKRFYGNKVMLTADGNPFMSVGEFHLKDIAAIYRASWTMKNTADGGNRTVSFWNETKDLGPANQFSIVRSIEQTLRRFGVPVNSVNVGKAFPIINRWRQESSKTVLIDENSSVVCAFHKDKEFSKERTESFLKQFNPKSIISYKGPEDKADLMNAIRNGCDMLWLDGHGGGRYFTLDTLGGTPGQEVVLPNGIWYKELADALIEGKGVKTIFIGQCDGGNFALKLSNELSKAFKDGRIKNVPLIISAANRDEASYPAAIYCIDEASKDKDVLTVAEIYQAEELNSMQEVRSDFMLLKPLSAGEIEELKSTLGVKGPGQAIQIEVHATDNLLPEAPHGEFGSMQPGRRTSAAGATGGETVYRIEDAGDVVNSGRMGFEELAEEMNRVYESGTGEKIEEVKRMSVDRLNKLIESRNLQLAMVEGRITGYIIYGTIVRQIDNKEIGHLEDVVVAKDAQHTGLGSILMDRAIGALKTRSFTEARVIPAMRSAGFHNEYFHGRYPATASIDFDKVGQIDIDISSGPAAIVAGREGNANEEELRKELADNPWEMISKPRSNDPASCFVYKCGNRMVHIFTNKKSEGPAREVEALTTPEETARIAIEYMGDRFVPTTRLDNAILPANVYDEMHPIPKRFRDRMEKTGYRWTPPNIVYVEDEVIPLIDVAPESLKEGGEIRYVKGGLLVKLSKGNEANRGRAERIIDDYFNALEDMWKAGIFNLDPLLMNAGINSHDKVRFFDLGGFVEMNTEQEAETLATKYIRDIANKDSNDNMQEAEFWGTQMYFIRQAGERLTVENVMKHWRKGFENGFVSRARVAGASRISAAGKAAERVSGMGETTAQLQKIVDRYVKMPVESTENVPLEIMMIFAAVEDLRNEPKNPLDLQAVLTGGTARDFAVATRSKTKLPFPVITDYDIAVLLPPGKEGTIYYEEGYGRLEEVFKQKLVQLGYPEDKIESLKIDFLPGVMIERTYVFENLLNAQAGNAFSISRLGVAKISGKFTIFGQKPAMDDLAGNNLRLWIEGDRTPGIMMSAKMLGKAAIYREIGAFTLDDDIKTRISRDIQKVREAGMDEIIRFMQGILIHTQLSSNDNPSARLEYIIKTMRLDDKFGRSTDELIAIALQASSSAAGEVTPLTERESSTGAETLATKAAKLDIRVADEKMSIRDTISIELSVRNSLKALGYNEETPDNEEILDARVRAVISENTRLDEPFSYSRAHEDAQKGNIARSFGEYITSRKSEPDSEKKIILYFVGTGREPREIRDTITEFYEELRRQNENAQGWNVVVYAIDPVPAHLPIAATSVEGHRFTETLEPLVGLPNLHINTYRANLFDAERLSYVLADTKARPDYIFCRNVRYFTSHFQFALIGSEDEASMLTNYLALKNLYSLAKPGTVLITESEKESNVMPIIYPGTTGEPGTGIARIENPDALQPKPGATPEKTLDDFLEAISENARLAQIAAPVLSPVDFMQIPDVMKRVSSVGEGYNNANKDAIVRAIIGMPAALNGKGIPTIASINRKVAEAHFGEREGSDRQALQVERDNRQFTTYKIHEGEGGFDATVDDLDRVISKQLADLPEDGRLVVFIFQPTQLKEDEAAVIPEKLTKYEGRVNFIFDYYTDRLAKVEEGKEVVEKHVCPDLMLRGAIARQIDAYYRATTDSDRSKAMAEINRLRTDASKDNKPIVTIDDLKKLPLIVKSICKTIEEWMKMEEATAMSV